MSNKQDDGKPELVFWFDAPPRAGAGAFGYVSQKWGNRVYYICCGPLSEERRIAGWEDCDHGDAIVIYLSEKANPNRFVKSFIREHPNTVHICNGFRSKAAAYTKRHIFTLPQPRIAVWSERPKVYGNLMKKLIRWLVLSVLYRYYALRFGNKISLLMPLGMKGIEAYSGFSWDRNIMFPFMYDPCVAAELPPAPQRSPGRPLRFLYVGRLSRSTKGVDVMVRAFENNLFGDWRLDIVGRHGDFEKQLIQWGNKHPRVSYLGIWRSSEVIQRIAQYDICLVPSRIEGWNVVINESIHAGVGVIATSETVSHELIQASGAGLIIPPSNVPALRQAIQLVIENPVLADSWKAKARAYSSRITSKSVGDYLISVLEYKFVHTSRPRPECPWL